MRALPIPFVLPRVALSIRQPYSWHILHDGKDIENRPRWSNFRGWVLIHAGKQPFDRSDMDLIRKHDMPMGGIVGAMQILDCVKRSDSEWFYGPYGLVIGERRSLPFVPCNGQLGFFRPDIDYAALKAAIEQVAA